MDKNKFAVTPPMGWNSYDYYDTTVTEADVKKNADFMAEKLKSCGWEYIVVDIEWYAHDAGSQRDRYQYIPFWEVETDEYSRLLPDPERFPSSAGGQGFKPLAGYVHDKGLKFGIHIMRGIPRQAAHRHTAILGSDARANDIADPANVCFWNPDMYGLRTDVPGAQEYYDSIMQLYAEWGVDYIKCDDICRMDAASAKQEIVMLHRAIEKCGRAIVLSLSPGPARIEEAWHYERYANMWRITDDFWDRWDLLLNMFERCELWAAHVSEGCWPDCDMLPVGKIGKAFGHEHMTGFTHNEQITMLTLWSIFRSPMMLGCELTQLDSWTLEQITNPAVMRLPAFSQGARQLFRDSHGALWMSRDSETGAAYLAVFNFDDTPRTCSVPAEIKEMAMIPENSCTELWSGEKYASVYAGLADEIGAHGAKLFKI